jgi:formyltetrahydrofolate deformylase
MEARLLISCADRHGIVAAVSGFLAARDANIVTSDQYSTDPEGGAFFMRMAFTIDALDEGLVRAFATEVAEPFAMDWRLDDAGRAKRVAVLVSREDHCLLDLLWRRRRGELHCEIPLVISNHPDHASDVEGLGVRYEHVPVVKGEKPAAEARMLELFSGLSLDLVVLARYMQILSGDFLSELAVPVINIHHSFLPAFVGANPYEQAKQRGVKLIGATAHYVTEGLDDGPIIEQDTVRVTHREDSASLMRLGADIERSVLARAVQWHCEDRVLQAGATTVVF